MWDTSKTNSEENPAIYETFTLFFNDQFFEGGIFCVNLLLFKSVREVLLTSTYVK